MAILPFVIFVIFIPMYDHPIIFRSYATLSGGRNMRYRLDCQWLHPMLRFI